MTILNAKWYPVVPAALLCAVLAVGCAPRKGAKKSGGDTVKSGQGSEDGGPAVAPGVDVEEAAIHGKEFAAIPDLKTVHFDYDAYSLSDEARKALQANADYLKGHKDFEVLVAGHCDERGTNAYNLALGQKRAKEVREYYLRLGVNGKSVATLSYGEEMASCSDQTEACWRENRRAETRVRARTVSNGHGGAHPKAPR